MTLQDQTIQNGEEEFQLDHGNKNNGSSSIGAHISFSGVELSIIVPTINECENVLTLFRCLDKCLAGRSWEVIFVDDDSSDGTAERVRKLAQRDNRVRCVQRIGRRGLSSACIEGMLASSAPYLAVLDGDLQHDETLLPAMLDSLKKNRDLDVVIGSRYVTGGGLGEWTGARVRISRIATKLGRLVLRANLTDPMSGFFMIRRKTFSDVVRKLSGIGFKILVDFFASSSRPLIFKEIPYKFRNRQAGESKMDSQAVWDYGMLLLDKLVGHIVPVRFISFSLVGGLGVFIHLSIVAVLFKSFKLEFLTSLIVATAVAMTFNFVLNNLLTYRDMRLRGWQWIRGWVSFSLASSVGAVANIGVGTHLFRTDTQWGLAALAGIIVGAVWNYVVTKVYTWKKV